MPSEVKPSPQQRYRQLHPKKLDDFYRDIKTEHQACYKPNDFACRSAIPEYLRKDNPFQTNSEKSMRHIRTTGPNAAIVSYVPTKDKYKMLLEQKTRESYEQIKNEDPSMRKFKLVNEINANPLVFGFLDNYEPQHKIAYSDNQIRRNHSEIFN